MRDALIHQVTRQMQTCGPTRDPSTKAAAFGAILFLVVILGPGCSQKASTEPIIIGHIAPLTGLDKAIGIQEKQGLLLAVEEANQEDHRVNGRRVAIEHADMRSDKEMTRAVATRLVAVNRVIAVLAGRSILSSETGSVAQSFGVPFILATGSPSLPVNDFVFHTGLSPSWRAQMLARYVSQELKPKSILLFAPHDSSKETAVSAFLQELPREITITKWDKADTNVPIPEKTPNSRPDVIVTASNAASFAELHLPSEWNKIPVIDLVGSTSPQNGFSNGLRWQAVYQAVPIDFDSDISAFKEFHQHYLERFHDSPGFDAALAYDDARLLFEAMRRAQSSDGAKIRESLSGLHYDGIAGPVQFNKDHTAMRTTFIVRVSDGQTKMVRKFDPDGK